MNGSRSLSCSTTNLRRHLEQILRNVSQAMSCSAVIQWVGERAIRSSVSQGRWQARLFKSLMLGQGHGAMRARTL